MLFRSREVARGGEGRHLDVAMMEGALGWTAAAQAQLAGGAEAPRRGEQFLSGRHPCYRVYPCADGFLSVGALEPKFWAALCTALGREDLISHQGDEGEAGRRTVAELEAIFRTATRAEWAERLRGLEVCVEPVLEVGEVAAHPQVRARGLLLDTETGREVRPQVVTGPGWRRLPPPGLGQHTAEVLAEAGIDAARLAALREEGAV